MVRNEWPPYRCRLAWAMVFVAGLASLLIMVRLAALVLCTPWSWVDVGLALVGLIAAAVLIAWPLLRGGSP